MLSLGVTESLRKESDRKWHYLLGLIIDYSFVSLQSSWFAYISSLKSLYAHFEKLQSNLFSVSLSIRTSQLDEKQEATVASYP